MPYCNTGDLHELSDITIEKGVATCLDLETRNIGIMSTINLPDLLTADGSLAVAAEVLEILFDEAQDIAFFVKDREGRYCVVNQSLVERNGLQHKSQLKGKRPSDVCSGKLGRIPCF